jgi:hypothetical protein
MLRFWALSLRQSGRKALFCCRNASSDAFSRKELIPLIRKIHPDLYHSESAAVRDANLRCIQDLYEVFDFLHAFNESANANQSVDRMSPLPASYNFHYHLRQDNQVNVDESNGRSQGGELREVKVNIKVPVALSERSAGSQLSRTKKRRALADLQHQLGKVFTNALLPLPWPDPGRSSHIDEPERNLKSEKPMESYESKARKMGVDIAAIDRAAVDHYLKQVLYSGAKLGSVGERERWLHTEIRQFLHQGNVLFRSISEIEQKRMAVERFYDFLLSHGASINFSCSAWENVVIILTGETDSAQHDEKGRKARNMPSSYVCTLLGPACDGAEERPAVVEVPHDFRSKLVMEMLGDLPQARDPDFRGT